MSGKDYIADYEVTEDNSEFIYEDFCNEMKAALDIMKPGKKGGYKVVAENLTWNGHGGSFTTTDKDNLINALLLNNGDCTTRMWWIGCCNSVIGGICHHHDVPMGTKFKIIRW